MYSYDARIFADASVDNLGLTYSVIAPLILPFSVATFSLFWVVFRYNLVSVSAFPYDTGGQLYPTALKQLFAGVYMMELCLIGLSPSICYDQGVFTGIGQAVVMMIATALMVIYQVSSIAFGKHLLLNSQISASLPERQGG